MPPDKPEVRDDLTHFIQLKIALERTLSQYGVSWRWVKKMSVDLASNVPEEGIIVDGYKIYRTKRAVFKKQVSRGDICYLEDRIAISKQ